MRTTTASFGRRGGAVGGAVGPDERSSHHGEGGSGATGPWREGERHTVVHSTQGATAQVYRKSSQRTALEGGKAMPKRARRPTAPRAARPRGPRARARAPRVRGALSEAP